MNLCECAADMYHRLSRRLKSRKAEGWEAVRKLHGWTVGWRDGTSKSDLPSPCVCIKDRRKDNMLILILLKAKTDLSYFTLLHYTLQRQSRAGDR